MLGSSLIYFLLHELDCCGQVVAGQRFSSIKAGVLPQGAALPLAELCWVGFRVWEGPAYTVGRIHVVEGNVEVSRGPKMGVRKLRAWGRHGGFSLCPSCSSC